MAGKYSQLFLLLTEAIDNFVTEVNKHSLSEMATDKWTVKDELSHVAFWHDYYAQNYAALAAGTKPFLFASKGGSTRNQEGVDKLKRKSHASLRDSIVVKNVPKMTYIVGSDYTTDRFLEMITGHINRHAVSVRHANR